MTRAERNKFEKDVYEICGRLNCCSAVCQIKDVTLQILRTVNSARQMGSIVQVTTIDVKSGKKSASQPPSMSEAENFGFHMIASLPKDVLQQCLDGNDFSTDPASRKVTDYDMILKEGAKIAGLL